jgi:hypothetical protein
MTNIRNLEYEYLKQIGQSIEELLDINGYNHFLNDDLKLILIYNLAESSNMV